MKTATKTIIITISFTIAICNAKAQSPNNTEPITLETLLQMQESGKGPFVITPIKIVNTSTGFNVQWQTLNEYRIASFELETGVTRKSYTSIKKIAAGNETSPSNRYEIGLKSSDVPSDRLHLRIKINYADGTSHYINETAVKMRRAN